MEAVVQGVVDIVAVVVVVVGGQAQDPGERTRVFVFDVDLARGEV